ncbi:uncharacterized protein BDR25DRAFT_320100 [Lindgomyces ingoldianus]|uniref:Uncharacterized protein n=1 Tax=Lindgomyces ingoldianus TaxID=673940 RepID=A0ACB6QAS9_9PLEO|nr:uncharacterized protein BDR25DRAFT_320100 [Lindgomyces ingoldianus]KAF2463250.1 hypothetical protein BDR25DRAFT_320100 [Lindgomyces ingoldianus]
MELISPVPHDTNDESERAAERAIDSQHQAATRLALHARDATQSGLPPRYELLGKSTINAAASEIFITVLRDMLKSEDLSRGRVSRRSDNFRGGLRPSPGHCQGRSSGCKMCKVCKVCKMCKISKITKNPKTMQYLIGSGPRPDVRWEPHPTTLPSIPNAALCVPAPNTLPPLRPGGVLAMEFLRQEQPPWLISGFPNQTMDPRACTPQRTMCFPYPA